MVKILFDFDGTLCGVETIPYVASFLGIKEYQEIGALTELAIRLDKDYEQNLLKRLDMMKAVSIDDFVGNVPRSLLRDNLVQFIQKHRDICAIVSCNLDCWGLPITDFLKIPCHFSEAEVKDVHVAGIKSILNKTVIVDEYQRDGFYVVFVGDSANDIDAMKKADDAILINNGDLELHNINDKIIVVSSESDLINQLESILKTHDNISDRRTTVGKEQVC